MTMFEIWNYVQDRVPVVKDWGWRTFSDWFRHMEKKGYAQVFEKDGRIIGVGVARPLNHVLDSKDRYSVSHSGQIAYVDMFVCEKSYKKDIFLERLIKATGIKDVIAFKRGAKQRMVTLNMEKFMRRF